MEIEVPLRRSMPAVDFSSDSPCSSPYLTAPSSPLRLPNPFSTAPASPDQEFAFEFGPRSAPLPAADDLFSGGLIRPLHPPAPAGPRPASPAFRGSRSMSPVRVSGAGGGSPAATSPGKGSRTRRRWKIRDLFRSASEGRYEVLLPAAAEGRRRVGAVSVSVSAHEEHYTANRAAAEEMRRRTFLPYRQGLFGCLGFNPHISSSRGIGSLTRG